MFCSIILLNIIGQCRNQFKDEKNSINMKQLIFQCIYCFIAIIAGGVFPIQGCVNIALKKRVNTSYRAGFVNFFCGVCVLLFISIIMTILNYFNMNMFHEHIHFDYHHDDDHGEMNDNNVVVDDDYDSEGISTMIPSSSSLSPSLSPSLLMTITDDIISSLQPSMIPSSSPLTYLNDYNHDVYDDDEVEVISIKQNFKENSEWWLFFGGVCGAVVVTLNIIGVLRFGAVAFSSSFVTSQLLLALIYDYYGAFHLVEKKKISMQQLYEFLIISLISIGYPITSKIIIKRTEEIENEKKKNEELQLLLYKRKIRKQKILEERKRQKRLIQLKKTEKHKYISSILRSFSHSYDNSIHPERQHNYHDEESNKQEYKQDIDDDDEGGVEGFETIGNGDDGGGGGGGGVVIMPGEETSSITSSGTGGSSSLTESGSSSKRTSSVGDYSLESYTSFSSYYVTPRK